MRRGTKQFRITHDPPVEGATPITDGQQVTALAQWGGMAFPSEHDRFPACPEPLESLREKISQGPVKRGAGKEIPIGGHRKQAVACCTAFVAQVMDDRVKDA